jgi:lipid-A-disaccharide synthase
MSRLCSNRPRVNCPVNETLMMVAGERSGDIYGARLAAALRARLPGIEIFGCGGELMRGAGVETIVDSHQFAMVGITEVVSGLPRAYRGFHALLDEAERRRPELAILIDSPSLNIRLAKRLKNRGITVVYFISPQIWAWKRWRLGQLKKRIHKMLCIFDFEETIYRQAGIPVEYVGHPLADTVHASLGREEFFAQAGLDPQVPTVALLPGSRQIELAFNLPTLLEAAAQVASARHVQFALSVAPTVNAEWIRTTMLRGYDHRAVIRTVSAPYDALRHSDLAVVASGTATVEAALLECPMVVVYRVSPVTAFFARFMINVPFYSMVNLLAGKPLVKELIQSDFTVENVAAQVEYLLDNAGAREQIAQELRTLKAHLGCGGAINRAAESAIAMMRGRDPVRV